MFECNCDCQQVEGFLKGVHKAHCDSLRAIYPEVWTNRYGDDQPVFPDCCPACGAVKNGEVPGVSVEYACGGGYRPKPQIQNHTNYWWGRCKVDEVLA